MMASKMKRRSSFFRRELECEDEEAQDTNTYLSEETLQQYIEHLKREQNEYVKESDSVKLMYKTYYKEKKNCMIKVTKAELYGMLSEEEKSMYAILFNSPNYNDLLDSIEELKESVAVVSIEHGKNLKELENHLERYNNIPNAELENLMNHQESVDLKLAEDLYASCEGDELSDFLDSDIDE